MIYICLRSSNCFSASGINPLELQSMVYILGSVRVLVDGLGAALHYTLIILSKKNVICTTLQLRS